MSDLSSPVTVNSRNYVEALKRSWTVKPLKIEADVLTFVGEFDEEIYHPDVGLIRRGTLSYEYFWLDRWYNIFRFHEPDGSLKCYYCNVIIPPIYSGGVVDYVDLDIDILVRPDLSYKVLDEEEFEENSKLLDCPANVVESARATRDMIVSAINDGRFPREFIPK